MNGLLGDLRYGVRSVSRDALLAATAILTIGIGAGANATVASFVDALLFRGPEAVEDPSTLVSVYTSDFSSGPYGWSSLPDYASIATEASAFTALAAYSDDPGAVATIGEITDRISFSTVTPNFFHVLGVRPTLGRLFTERDASSGEGTPAVIGDALWTRAFNRNASALGATLTVRGRRYTIIGVAPEGFRGLDLSRASEIWTLVPPATPDPNERSNRGLAIVGRLQPGVTHAQAQEQLNVISSRLAREYPDTNRGTLQHPDQPRPFTVTPYTRLGAESRARVVMLSTVIGGASLLVLLIATANVGNLLLARSATRQRELAIRLAMGASRGRIMRQLLLESVCLGAAGGIVGLMFALWTSDLLPSFFPPEQVGLLDAQIDARVLTFCLGLSVLATVAFGLAPAAQALHSAPAGVLRREAGTVTESRTGSRARRAFVVVQVALACVLLVAAGLLVRSLRNALEADLGFATRAGVVISIDLPSELPPDRGQAFYREALQRTQSIPGVEVAALSTVAPLNRGGRRTFHVADYQPAEGEDMELPINVVSPGYFAAMGIPVVAGRVFDDTDRADGNLVVMVNAEFARRFLPNGALGKRVRDARRREFTIVGVAGATALGPPGSPRLPVVYYPLAQSYVPGVRLIAKTSMDPSSLLPVVAREVKAITSQVAVFRPVTIRTSINDALTTDRLLASLVGACGVLALLLATVGLYGMVAYSVATKAREISIRIALGASAQRVWQLVIQESMRLTTAGIVIGGALAIAVGIGMRAMLYQVSPVDAWTFGAVLVMLFAVTLIAAWVPLRRALRVDPANVLRQI